MGRDKAFFLRFGIGNIFLWAWIALVAQTPTIYTLQNDIPVSINGQVLPAAWAGGLNSPQFGAIDLNQDGKDDLVIFDRMGHALLPFLNGGTTNVIDYTFAPQYIDAFPADLSHWMLLADFDADGYPDIFTNLPGSSNLRVFRNTTPDNSGNLGFSLYADTIFTEYPPYQPLYMAKSDLPAIIDVDEDGDLDILTFHLAGREVEWHRNVSMEIYNDLLHLEFFVQSHCFGHFQEDQVSCSVNLEIPPCSPGERQIMPFQTTEQAGLHSGSTLLALDLNADTLKDLIIADVDCANVLALRNAGTLELAHYDFVEDNYPSNDVPVNIPVFPATFFMDLDNDGIKDLIAAPNKLGDVEDVRGVSWHKNVGHNNLPDFRFQKYGLLSEGMIETGTASVPVFFDYNADGLQDLLIGNLGRFDSMADYVSRLALYENTGTGQLPAFTLITKDYLGFSSHVDVVANDWFVPAIADLDGDGDPDMLIGGFNGTLYYFRNDASTGGTANFTYVMPQYAGIDVGLYSAPELFDLDGDGDFDLLIGNHQGYIQYFENTGSAQIPNFIKVTDSLGRVKVNDFTDQDFTNGYAKPRMIDVDRDGQFELLVGSLEGEVQVYDQVSATPGAIFTRKVNLAGKDFGRYAAVAAAKLDSSRLTYVIGIERGGLLLLRDSGILDAPESANSSAGEIIVFPNPGSKQIQIQLKHVPGKQNYLLQLWNVSGQLLLEDEFQGENRTLEVGNFVNGIYFLIIKSDNVHISSRIIVKK
ncbi:MAG TPA: T9SS type A sorting domain-containing protein [Bacteroidetes bacterium]|nr:T9SS type A sorting domain-containing protein [Bacteroidota bacterium]